MISNRLYHSHTKAEHSEHSLNATTKYITLDVNQFINVNISYYMIKNLLDALSLVTRTKVSEQVSSEQVSEQEVSEQVCLNKERQLTRQQQKPAQQ